MAGGSRARLVRAFAGDLQSRCGIPVEAHHDSGPKWDLVWTDGPSRDTVRALARAADLAGAQLRYHRDHTMIALALTAVTLAGAGRLPRFTEAPLDRVESALEDLDFPERPADAMHERLARQLLAEARTPRDGLDDRLIASLLCDHGLGWLYDTAARAGAELPPLIVLSARYAAHAAPAQEQAWRERAEPLPLRTAVTAALADEQLTAPAALALVAVLPQLRAELARTEAAVTAAAQHAGVTPEQISTVLGTGIPETRR